MYGRNQHNIIIILQLKINKFKKITAWIKLTEFMRKGTWKIIYLVEISWALKWLSVEGEIDRGVDAGVPTFHCS